MAVVIILSGSKPRNFKLLPLFPISYLESEAITSVDSGI